MRKRVGRFIEHVLLVMEQRFRRSSASFAMLILLAVGIYFVIGFAREVVHGQQLSTDVTVEQQRNDELAKANARLQEQQQYYQSDEYVELAARESLNLRKPDQIIGLTILPTPTAQQPAAVHPPRATNPSQPAPPPAANWQIWFGLFFK